MEEIASRISQVLVKEEAQAEQFANTARLVLIFILSFIAILNTKSVSVEANVMNFSALLLGYAYGFVVFFRIRRAGYHPMMKYITSCLDILLVFLLLLLYTRISNPSVAVKNYVFLIVFPLLALTAFRYDRKLIGVAGGLAVVLYLALIFHLYFSGSITFTNGGYDKELFSTEVTYIGQLTKVLILTGYVILVSYLVQYSRNLFVKLVREELNLQSQKESIEWELKIAAHVQTQFLNRSIPSVAGLELYAKVEQGKFVGGDYCDFLKLADDLLFVVIADVCGKGVPAALIMAEVHAATQLLVSMKIDLETLIQRLNSLLFQNTDKKNFVSFFAAEINTSRQRITYVNAGHPLPLIHANGTVHTLHKGTIPLGLQALVPRLVTHVDEFTPGSVLVAYTDGLLEQTDTRGEQFGEERLIEYVRLYAHLDAQVFTRQLLAEIRNFGNGKGLDDDVGLAIAKFSTGLCS